MSIHYEKAGKQHFFANDTYFVYDSAFGGDRIGSVNKMADGSWRAVSNGMGRYFRYRHEAAEWLVSINQVEQSNG